MCLLFINCKQINNEQRNYFAQTIPQMEKIMQKQSVHQFQVNDLSGESFNFLSLNGKKVMIVNTASECGYTPQYEQLQELYITFKDQNFTIVGFPSNDFGAQEPGTNTEIATFCKKNYGVTFPMMSKISVKGDDMHEVYTFLTQKEKNGISDNEVDWNFQKYLLGEDGYLVRVVPPKVSPVDESIMDWLEGK